MSEFLGWRLLGVRGPLRQFFLPYSGRALLVTGPNGTGKSTLLNTITSGDSDVELVFSGVPRRLAQHLSLLRERVDDPSAGSLQSALSWLKLLDSYDNHVGAACPSDDDREWLESVLGGEVETGVTGSSIRWYVSGDPLGPSISVPTGDAVRSVPLQRWVVPSSADAAVVGSRSADAFQRWTRDVSAACSSPARPTGNSLVVDVGGLRQSVLELSEIWAEHVATRAQARFAVATGLDCRLRCDPADGFSWQWKEGKSWLAPDLLSTGLSRWFALSVLETLREYETIARSAAAPLDWAELSMNPPSWAFPTAQVDVFAGEPYWLAVDEPELHLYPTEERHLAEELANQAAGGRMVLATHSLHLAASFVGSADFVTFSGAGDFEVHQPPSVVSRALVQLSSDSPAILARVQVLYVEGEWDKRVLEALWPDQLAQSRVIVEPVHGVNESQKAIATVWNRMLGHQIWILFDLVTEQQVKDEWQAVRAQLVSGASRRIVAKQLRQRAEERGSNEKRALLSLLGSLVSQSLEDRVHFACHEMSDILQTLHPRRFGIDHDSWSSAGYSGNGSFKSWYRRSTGRELGADTWPAWKSNPDADDAWDSESLARLTRALEPLIGRTEIY